MASWPGKCRHKLHVATGFRHDLCVKVLKWGTCKVEQSDYFDCKKLATFQKTHTVEWFPKALVGAS